VLEFTIASSRDDFISIAQEMVAQKRMRYAQTGAADLLVDKLIQDFYVHINDKTPEAFTPHCSALKLDGDIIATHWGLQYKNTFYYLLPAFKQGWTAKYSSGRILLEHLVETAIENNLKIFDFSIGSESYKLDWCNEKESLYTVQFPMSFLGRLHTSGKQLLLNQKKMLKRFRFVMYAVKLVKTNR